jgi:transcriptional regulator with XRE-family HTH domain
MRFGASITEVRATMDNRIADFRHMRGMSLDDLSEASGLSKSTLSELERGITKPMLDSARRIASALDAYESELWPEDSTMPLTVRTTDTALAAAEARIAELEKALEPFARDTDYRITDDTPVTLSMVNHLTVGDLRHAAALLKEKE